MHTDDNGDEYELVTLSRFSPMVDERTLEVEERHYPADDSNDSLYEVTISAIEKNHRTEVHIKSSAFWFNTKQLQEELATFAAFRAAVHRAYERLDDHANREVFPTLKRLGY